MKLTANQLLELVQGYLEFFPDEQARLQLLLDQLIDGGTMNDRYNFRGHITASGLVLSPDKSKVLLIHHRGSGNWQQPGGHWETDEEPNPLEAARREVVEETAATIEAYWPFQPKRPLIPLDIDTHWIPTPRHADEQPHYHHDFLYLFTAAHEHVVHQAEEVYGANWFVFDAPECSTEKMQRVLTKFHDRILLSD